MFSGKTQFHSIVASYAQIRIVLLWKYFISNPPTIPLTTNTIHIFRNIEKGLIAIVWIIPSMKKILLVILGILMLSICLAGCTSQPPAPTPVPTPLTVATRPPMTFPVGVEWRLTSYLNGANVMTRVTGEKPVTAKFDSSGALSGSGGCNQYSATYKVTGTSISITQPITTLMACPEPIMQQETLYLAQLTKASSYNSLGDTLTFFDASGATILVYKRPLDGGASQVPIVGVWDLFSYNNGKGAIQTVITGSQTTADFRADWKLSGSAGCNQYSAGYTTTSSNGITITQPTSTRMACENNLMQQETQYLSLLPTSTKYEISGDQLTLFNSAGTKILIYQSDWPEGESPIRG